MDLKRQDCWSTTSQSAKWSSSELPLRDTDLGGPSGRLQDHLGAEGGLEKQWHLILSYLTFQLLTRKSYLRRKPLVEGLQQENVSSKAGEASS